MGIFKKEEKQKTEIEIFLENLSKINLENNIEVIIEVENYLKDIKEGKEINPFNDETKLINVVAKYIETHIEKTETIIDFISQVKNTIDMINENTTLEELQNCLLLFNTNGIYESNLFDINLYRMFNNIKEYIVVVNMIIENNLKKDFNIIKDFLIEIRSKLESGEKYYYYILYFMNKITYGTNIEELIEKEKVEINKKEGIYDLDESVLDLLYEKTLSSEGIISELERLITRADKINNHITRKLDSFKTSLTEISQNSLKKYQIDLESALEKLNELITKSKEELDTYTLTKREEIAKQLQDEQTKIISSLISERDRIIISLKRFEETLTTLALAKTSEITRIGSEQISNIDKALTDAPHLKEVMSDLAGLVTDKKVLDTITELSKLDLTNVSGSTKLTTPAQRIITPREGIIVSSPNIIISDEPVDYRINKYFDPKRSMKSRLEELKEKIEQNTEEKGIIYHSKTIEILKYILYGNTPYLYGPSGGGKSMAVSLIADLLELPLNTMNYINEEYEVRGAEPFLNNFTPSQIHNTFKKGGLAFVDEMDNGNARATVALNPFLRKTTTEYMFSNRELVKRHPNFRMITAGNTDGLGATNNHSTREGIEGSVFQRLKGKIYIGYDPTIEKNILKDYPEWYNFILAFREALASYKELNEGEITLSDAVTTSDITDIKEYLSDGIMTIEEIIEGDFIQAKSIEYLNAIKTYLDNHYNKKAPEKELKIYKTFQKCSKKYIYERKIG